MLARTSIFARFDARFENVLDVGALARALTSKRAQYLLAHVTMVLGYLSLITNPLDGDAMLLGLLCQAVAIPLYFSSKRAV